MSSDRAASSSDLERARALSHRLAAVGAESPAPRAPLEESKYVRFRPAAVTDLPTPVRAVPAAPDPAAFGGVEGWDSLLDWVRSACGAHAAFLIDGQGLLVAKAGELDRERAEGMGARMVFAMEHADRMAEGESSRSLVVDFGEHVATSLRTQTPDGRQFVLGVVASAPLSPDARREVERALIGKLGAS